MQTKTKRLAERKTVKRQWPLIKYGETKKLLVVVAELQGIYFGHVGASSDKRENIIKKKLKTFRERHKSMKEEE